MESFITSKKAKQSLGVCESTLRRWADNGTLSSIRTPGGQRLYSIKHLLNTNKHPSANTVNESGVPGTNKRVCYCRVSSRNQRDDLERQVTSMREQFPGHQIIQDIGSGINFKRTGLRSILEMASKGLIREVVVAYRDRLCRFAFELVEWVLLTNGVKLVVLNQGVESSENSELAEDLLSIINVFNCRVNGRRKYKSTKAKDKQIEKEQEVGGQSIIEDTTGPEA